MMTTFEGFTGTGVVIAVVGTIWNYLKNKELTLKINGLLIQHTNTEKKLSYEEGIRDEKAREIESRSRE
jgi:hypothetical protein